MIKDASTALVLSGSSFYVAIGSDGSRVEATFIFCFFAAIIGSALRSWSDKRPVRDKAPEACVAVSVGAAGGLFLSKAPLIVKYVGDNPIAIGVLVSLLISLSLKELKDILVWLLGFGKDFLTQKFLKK